MVDNMDIKKEDTLSVIITFCLLLTWYVTLISFNYPLFSILILWIGMIILTIIYCIIYYKKKRDMKILKMRFFVSIVPIYSALVFYIYMLIYGKKISDTLRLMPVGIIVMMLLLNAIVVYFFSRKD